MTSQADFIRALFEAGTTPPGLCDPTGAPAQRRFGVYRNNVGVALTETLGAAFPAVARLVGPEFFAAMAHEFIAAHPPESPVMALYGAAFPDWLRNFPPVSSLPYLPEVAAIEQARREATHAADCAPLNAEEILDLGPDGLAQSRLSPHPALRMIATHYAALSIWARNAGRDDLTTAPPGEVLICRPEMDLIIRPAPVGTMTLIEGLSQGLSLNHALPNGTDHAAIFACLFASGALIRQTEGAA